MRKAIVILAVLTVVTWAGAMIGDHLGGGKRVAEASAPTTDSAFNASCREKLAGTGADPGAIDVFCGRLNAQRP